ncbi:cyclic-AMP-regulated phospho protein family protein [Coniochaeta sp. 2T2.1]|nr:cyclic-AMP-regulated phospho protein family protein [Coniochaeta sp. 2T2.1]
MNPHQKNKIDVSSLSPEEQRLFRLYGKLPSKSDHFAKHLKERKYFDSGDYALSKAGKADSVDTGSVGSEHPLPENIPHLSSPGGGIGSNGVGGSLGGGGMGTPLLAPHHVHQAHQAGSPVKESSFLHRETRPTADDGTGEDGKGQGSENAEAAGIPIRR